VQLGTRVEYEPVHYAAFEHWVIFFVGLCYENIILIVIQTNQNAFHVDVHVKATLPLLASYLYYLRFSLW